MDISILFFDGGPVPLGYECIASNYCTNLGMSVVRKRPFVFCTPGVIGSKYCMSQQCQTNDCLVHGPWHRGKQNQVSRSNNNNNNNIQHPIAQERQERQEEKRRN
jgi:hypothetical protein